MFGTGIHKRSFQRIFDEFLRGIRFGDHIFTEPLPLTNWSPVQARGVYVVLVPDLTWGPRQFQPLLFEEFRSSGSLTPADYLRCLKAAAGQQLYISILITSGALSSIVKHELVEQYDPVCNREASGETVTSLAGRLGLLEKKYSEQETLLRLALAALGHLIPPAPEAKKKVGFRAS